MKKSTHVVLSVLFSFLLLSVLFSSVLQTAINDMLSHIEYQGALQKITEDPNVELLSNYMLKDKREVPVIVKPVLGTTHKHHRFALSSSYWEQQTNAVLNMFCMQRWANSIGMTVVEPFVSQSELKFPAELLHNNTLASTLRLHDYIDLKYWNTRASESGVPPLKRWENFVLHSTKKIVVVIMSYFGAGGTYVNGEIKNHPNCHKVMLNFFQDHSAFFNSLQFQVVRNVCFSFFNYIMPVETFNAGLQIENEKDVTVWISEWRGVENGRVSFTGLGNNEFGRTKGGEHQLLSMIHSSDRLLHHSQKYVNQVLGVEFYKYDAVVIRVKPINGYTTEMNVQYYNNCASLLEKFQKDQKEMVSLRYHRAFLAIDMGKFGDMVRGDSFDYDSQGKYTGHGTYLFRRFLSIVYGEKSITNYEDDFARVTNGITDSGYIGALQKTIAVHAERVLIVGGHSTFQKVVMQHFAKRHISNPVLTLCYQEY